VLITGKKKAALHNLGCKVNSYELDVVQQNLIENGYEIVPFTEEADIYIVNTCTVTNIADRKSRQMLHRAKAKNPQAVVVAVGCYVQTGREDVVMDVLHDAAELAIKEDAKTITTDLTLKLAYQNEQWWIIADRDLLDAISGGILY